MHVPSCNIIYTANLTKSPVIPKSPYMSFKYIEPTIKNSPNKNLDNKDKMRYLQE